MSPEQHDHDRTPALSEAGEARRDAMLVELQRTMRRRQERLSAVRRTCGTGLLVILLGIAIFLQSRPPAPSPAPTPQIVELPPGIAPEQPEPRSRIVRIDTDADVVSRYAITPTLRPDVMLTSQDGYLANVIYVDDSTLLDLLDEMGRPTGIVRMDGRITLTNAVTDPMPMGL